MTNGEFLGEGWDIPAPPTPTIGYPDNNPKTAFGAVKVPLHLVPPSAKHYLAQALADGARKYGPYNWRDTPISVSVYKAALERHMDAYWDGEDVAADSLVHHVAHAMACCALILDAMSVGKLIDDRPTNGAASRLQREYVKPKVDKWEELIKFEQLKEMDRAWDARISTAVPNYYQPWNGR